MSAGIVVIALLVLYFVIKCAVKNGITEAYEEITGKKIKDDTIEILEKEDAGKETNRE